MLELFSRRPDGLHIEASGQLTPIPFDQTVSSLSAILMDDDYYAFVRAGRREQDGVPWVGADRLIPLKASAWLDLTARKQEGELIDSKNIRKHAADIVQLSGVLAEEARIELPERVLRDLVRFLELALEDMPRGVGPTVGAVASERIRMAFVLAEH